MHRQRTPSPAALLLASAGVTQKYIASRVGKTQAAVSLELSGNARLQPDTLLAIRQVAGSEVADRIADIHGGAK